jgi:hypothetical protein
LEACAGEEVAMSEVQEKVWVILRTDDWYVSEPMPVKVFDDRKDARSYVKSMKAKTDRYLYAIRGVRKG